ncbi:MULTISPECIES: DNA mismatch repair protein MutS [Polaribacter]|uniref:DNA mismatch repair protein MutS n=1 Tax=Polaribacter sejongensis TaxID=985043 RepID=A0AAJ1QUR2_9FLAO|nr:MULTISPECIES: DNA mismatch repair protein MutS [Polaribacter]AUC24018.1 DNA mismatch repair protein MutS [Polaribacter sejongensis]MDN3618546.1 DNA mismatch repair protein MutS [Polaribacter undariae]UWD30473.1 DNA mismatch repair protein MutS [Polaribacter undariae]
MNTPSHFYSEEKSALEKESAQLKKKSINLSIFRFGVFLATGFLIYLTFGKYPDVFIIAFLGILLFAFLVVKHINLQKKRAIIKAKISINTTEIDVLNRKFHQLESGKEFVNPMHYYSNDIDLFGVGSFFQYLNRSVTAEGKKLLANTFTENKTDGIVEKQNTIKELATKVKWRQHFGALASLITTKDTSGFIVSWIQNYKIVLPKVLGIVQIVFSIASLTIIGLVSFGIVPFSILVIWFFIGLFITGAFVKKTSNLYADTDKVRETFKQYHVLLNEIENENFTSKVLVEKQQIINSETKKASAIFKEFSRVLDAFDQRNNVVISVVGNGLFLTEIRTATNVEKWISKYKHTVDKWFSVVAFFDAQNSLANFHFNHTKFVFPEITSDKEVVKATNLGHPLLDATKRIDNNFTIHKEEFFIVTGANMAGKSTFLRTISLSIVMANCGLPVCAENFKYAPIKLITSMRTTDSLTEDESYFYSELKRLKFIVDEIKTTDYFIVLDEILKGTNSKDKAIGSKKFVEKLTKSKSTGIIATHDVSLCELENEFTDIKNYYFDAEISNNELSFDYTLKNGICKNMNASFLLQKMEIV